MSQIDGDLSGNSAAQPDRFPLTPESAVSTVRDMIDMMAAGGVKELDVRFGDVSIRLRSQGKTGPSQPSAAVSPEASLPAPSSGQFSHAITAPMIGTFYASPSPQDPPFVRVGEQISAGQVIGIIEAMKIMNEIVADVGGTVAEVVAENGQAVEYGSPLVRLAPLETGTA